MMIVDDCETLTHTNYQRSWCTGYKRLHAPILPSLENQLASPVAVRDADRALRIDGIGQGGTVARKTVTLQVRNAAEQWTDEDLRLMK